MLGAMGIPVVNSVASHAYRHAKHFVARCGSAVCRYAAQEVFWRQCPHLYMSDVYTSQSMSSNFASAASKRRIESPYKPLKFGFRV